MRTNLSRISFVTQLLQERQLASGGWSYLSSPQISVEATALAVLALSDESPERATWGTTEVLHLQRVDGSWPAFLGDSEGSWTSPLALCALNQTSEFLTRVKRVCAGCSKSAAVKDIGFGAWKFKTSDRNVRFDPDKYGWPWSHGAGSWVIPTAFTIVAIKQCTVCNRSEASENRFGLGVEMLLGRVCVGGGWNSGNSVVCGAPLSPHVEATVIALLALQDEPRREIVQASVTWLESRAAEVEAVSSLCWCILTLFVYQRRIDELKRRLAALLGNGRAILNNATLATALLALRCGERIHPLMVLR